MVFVVVVSVSDFAFLVFCLAISRRGVWLIALFSAGVSSVVMVVFL